MLEIALTSILHSTDQRAATRDIRYSARAEQTFTRECYSGHHRDCSSSNAEDARSRENIMITGIWRIAARRHSQ